MPIRPLLPTRADQARFIDRTAETRAIGRALDERRNVLLLGERGSGKSSLLSHVAYERRNSDQTPVTVVGETARSPAALLLNVLAKLEPGGFERWLNRLGASTTDVAPPLQAALTARLLDELAAAADASAGGVAVAIDGIDPDVAHDLFGSARNDVWAVSAVTWVVAGRREERDLLLRPPADAFFDAVVELGPLDPDAAARLLRSSGADVQDERLQSVVEAAAGNPALLLRAAALAQEGRDPAAVVPVARWEQGTRGALVHWLTVHGSASAADPALREALGVSRQRVSQLLSELEGEGHLRKVAVRPEGEGRPRNVYTLVSA